MGYKFGHRDARHAAAELVSAALAVSPVAPAAPPWVQGQCLPDGVMFDAFGNPRTRYVRVTFEGQHCIVLPGNEHSFSDSDNPEEYVRTDVYLSEREYEALPEFDGF